MKHLSVKSIAIFIFSGLVLWACNNMLDNRTDSSVSEEKSGFPPIPSVIDQATIGGLQIPKGTKVIQESDNKILLDFPKGINLVAKNSAGEVTMSGDEAYQCTCTGEGCDVIWLPTEDEVGCSSCDDTCTGEWVDVETDGAGFVNLKEGISFIDRGKDSRLNLQRPSFELMKEVPALEKKMESFKSRYLNRENTAQPNSSADRYVGVNVFGSVMAIKISKSSLNDMLSVNQKMEQANLLMSEEEPECKCTSGSSGCDLKEIKEGIFHVGWECEANECESCAMIFPETDE